MNTSIIGNVVATPELSSTNSGVAVTSFTVAVNQKRGEVDVPSFFDCQAYGTMAEGICKEFEKGSRVVIVGTLTQQRWTDATTQQNRSRVVITVEGAGFDLRFVTLPPKPAVPVADEPARNNTRKQ